MALKTVAIDVALGLSCGDHPAAESESIKIHLNPVKYAGALPIDAVIVGLSLPKSVTDAEGNLVPGITYTVQYEADDLPGSLERIDACDVFSLQCQNCCDALDEKFTEITDDHESRVADEETISSDHETRLDAIETYLGEVPLLETTWPAIVAALNAGNPVLVSTVIEVDSSEVLNSGSLHFEMGGKLNTNGFEIEFNIPVLNPGHFHVFDGYVLDEDYPERWTNLGSTITGNFGGINDRYPKWWGLTTTTDPNNGTQAVADKNNDAIAAAALSAGTQNAAGAQLTVRLPAGAINVYRPVRIDGVRVRLQGQGSNASQLWAQSNAYAFDTAHYILTEDYPVAGSTPVVEIGYERDPVGTNFDEGFQGGVVELAIICPVTQAARRVSGLMWESGLQEQTAIEFVNVQNYGGYAIGGPRFQRLEHNDPSPASYYTQLNNIEMHDLWLFSANKPDAIGMSVFGVGFNIWNVTVDHGRENTFGGVIGPAIITGARANGRWSMVRIEQGPAANGHIAIGVEVPNDGVGQKLSFDAITYKVAAPFLTGLTSRALCLKASNGGFACGAISNETARNYEAGNWAIEDAARGKLSGGWHGTQANSSYVARYDREEHENVFYVVTTDPLLDEDHGLRGSKAYTIPTVNDGSITPLQTISVTGAVVGKHFVRLTFTEDLKGLEPVVWVSAADTVSFRFSNQTGVVVSGIPAGTVKVKLAKI